MKRIIFILLLLYALAASAQNHLEFNGIPIDGSISAFTEKMKAAGYLNEKAQVLDQAGNIIAGLFAAGEVTGGLHGNNRIGGNSIAETVVFGRQAGQQAAVYLA